MEALQQIFELKRSADGTRLKNTRQPLADDLQL